MSNLVNLNEEEYSSIRLQQYKTEAVFNPYSPTFHFCRNMDWYDSRSDLDNMFYSSKFTWMIIFCKIGRTAGESIPPEKGHLEFPFFILERIYYYYLIISCSSKLESRYITLTVLVRRKTHPKQLIMYYYYYYQFI